MVGRFSKEIPRNPDDSLGPVTIRAWYEKEKGLKPVPLEGGSVALIPGCGWSSDQLRIRHELGPEKNRLYITVDLIPGISLSHYFDSILRKKPIRLKVILFPAMPVTKNGPLFGPALPVEKEVEITIPEMPEPDIHLDVRGSWFAPEKTHQIRVTAVTNLPLFISEKERAEVLKKIVITTKDPVNVTIKKKDVLASSSEVIHILYASPNKVNKPASVTIKAALSLQGRTVTKKKRVQFEENLQYVLSLSTDTVHLEKEYIGYPIGKPGDDPYSWTSSFKVWVYDVSSGDLVNCLNRSWIDVRVPTDAQKILDARIYKDWENECFVCRLTSKGARRQDPVLLSVSASVSLGKETVTLPEKPVVRVFLQPAVPVILTIGKEGFEPCEINLSERYPEIAGELLATGGTLEISGLEGSFTLKEPVGEEQRGETLTAPLYYAWATLRIGDSLTGMIYSCRDEETVSIAVKDRGNVISLPGGFALELDEGIAGKLVRLKKELDRYPRGPDMDDYDALFLAYARECLALFSSQKNTDLDNGLAETLIGRVARTWAFIRLGNRIHPLLERTERITLATVQKASENFLNFFLQVLLCVAPRISERLTGHNAPKTADDIAREAKEIVNREMREEYQKLFTLVEGLKESIRERERTILDDVVKRLTKAEDLWQQADSQFRKIINSLKETAKNTEDADDLLRAFDHIYAKYPRAIIPDPGSGATAGREFFGYLDACQTNHAENLSRALVICQELSVFLDMIKDLPENQRATFKDMIASLGEKYLKPAFREIGEIPGDLFKWEAYNSVSGKFIPGIENLLKELENDPLGYSPSLQKVIDKIRFDMVVAREDIENLSINLLKNMQEALEVDRNLRVLLEEMQASVRSQKDLAHVLREIENYSLMASRKKEEATIRQIAKVNELKIASEKIREDIVKDIIEEILKSQPAVNLYNGLVDSQRDRRLPRTILLDDFGIPYYNQYWMRPGEGLFSQPGAAGGNDQDERERKWREIQYLFHARQDSGNLCYQALGRLFAAVNQSCINWALYWKIKVTAEEKTITFPDEAFERAKVQYSSWGIEPAYFGAGSCYLQLAELGAILQGINVIPDLRSDHHETTKKQVVSHLKKTLQEKRTEVITRIFSTAAKGALAPESLSNAPEGVTSSDLDLLFRAYNEIAETVQGYEQAQEREEYYRNLPFFERQVTYLTSGLGEALVGTNTADTNQLVDWISYWGTWGFILGSLAFPAVGWVSLTTMATMAAGKDFIFDIGLSFFQAAPLTHVELEVVSGMYRDLLILFAIAYIGFYSEKIDFVSLCSRKKAMEYGVSPSGDSYGRERWGDREGRIQR